MWPSLVNKVAICESSCCVNFFLVILVLCLMLAVVFSFLIWCLQLYINIIMNPICFLFMRKSDGINLWVNVKELLLFVSCEKAYYFDALNFVNSKGYHLLCLSYLCYNFLNFIDHNKPGSSASSLSSELHRDQHINTIPVSDIFLCYLLFQVTLYLKNPCSSTASHWAEECHFTF